MSPATAHLPSLKIALGAEPSGVSDPSIPVIAGGAVEDLFPKVEPAGHKGALALFQHGDWLVGAATVATDPGLEKVAQRLYQEIFAAVRGLHLVRIWNYVPAINTIGPDGLEHYQAFCRGRSLAFEQELGEGFKAFLPSASAVGSKSADLTVIFAASVRQPRHVENPLQVPAYDYPDKYGPRPPSFARATIVPGPDRPTVFVSGTAAVRGHATIAPDSTLDQLDCTLENLREISLACGLGPDLDAPHRTHRHFKVYLRHTEDQPAVSLKLEKSLLRPEDDVSYLHADICRASLSVEIEATLIPS